MDRKHPLAKCEQVVLTDGSIALVSPEDYERVIQFKWYRMQTQDREYARMTSHKHGKLFLHNFILGEKKVDHINGNCLDNRRENLRKATQQENARNSKKREGCTSRFKGVYRNSTNTKWIAQICIDGKSYNLGAFDVEEDAARKYDERAMEVFGEYARTNF